jgi:protein phosphatase
MYTRTASLTDVGSVRTTNQDRCGEFVDDAGYRLLIVADGMGGHRGGEVASQTTVNAVGEVFQRGVENPVQTLCEAFTLANQRVYEMAAQEADLTGMGTTGVALLIGPARTGWLANVGDSRAYRIREGCFEPLTHDHSWVFEEVRHNRLTPEEAAVHPRKNVLTRSIGVDATIEVDIAETDLEPGDRFLLCSDGLWGEVSEEQIAEVLISQEPDQAVQTLVELANTNGGPDNITVQIAVVPSRIAAEDSESTLAPEGVGSGSSNQDTDSTLPLGEPDPEAEFEPERTQRRRRTSLLTAAAAAVAGLLIAALVWLLAAGTEVKREAPVSTSPNEQATR